MSAKRALSRGRAPDEREAEERAWAVVRSAYRERPAAVRRRARWRLVLVPALAAIVAGVALSPAGAAVSRLVRQALGIQHAAHALFSLPAPGRLLVSGPGGTWTVSSDGLKRRLGPWPQASWSPHGIYVLVARGDELAAINPRGTPQWALARAAVGDPRWYAPSGYRVAYLSGDDLRVVAGDGTGDHLLATGVAKIAPAWRPNHRPYQLAYVTKAGRLGVRDGDTGKAVWSAPAGAGTNQVAWSAGGRRLVALSARRIRLYSANGHLITSTTVPRETPAIAGALAPDGHTLALVLAGGRGDEVILEDLTTPKPAPRRVLAGSGLDRALWSPDGRWLLVSWPTADQWVFVHVAGKPQIAAVSHIAQQFATATMPRGFPQVDGWCCSAQSPAR